MPGSIYPIQALYLGIPVVVEGHTGKDIAANIKKVTDKYIEANQFKGISCDGQYFNLGVDKYLDEHYDATGSAHHDHDPMHRAWLVDTHL